MSAIGSGYDQSVHIISPDGRIYQVEYALKAVDITGTIIGMRGRDGVVFAAEKLVASKLHEPGQTRRLFSIDKNIGVAVAGWITDGRQIVDVARSEAANLRKSLTRDFPIVKSVSERISSYMHAYTLYGSVRPFGASIMLGAYDCDGASLYMIDPSGMCNGYFGCAIGKGKQAAKTELEKLTFSDMSCVDLVNEAAKIIYTVHDEEKDKAFEMELSWVGEITKGVHEHVPEKIFNQAEMLAKASVAEDLDSDEEK